MTVKFAQVLRSKRSAHNGLSRKEKPNILPEVEELATKLRARRLASVNLSQRTRDCDVTEAESVANTSCRSMSSLLYEEHMRFKQVEDEKTSVAETEILPKIREAILQLEKKQLEIKTNKGNQLQLAKCRLRGLDKNSTSLADQIVASNAMARAESLEEQYNHNMNVMSRLRKLECNVMEQNVYISDIDETIETILNQNFAEEHSLSKNYLVSEMTRRSSIATSSFSPSSSKLVSTMAKVDEILVEFGGKFKRNRRASC